MAQLTFTRGARSSLGTRLLSRRHGPAADADANLGRATTRNGGVLHPTPALVRVLEAALEEQERRVAELTDELETERARPLETVRRVAATVDGLRVAFGKDPAAQRLLSRIDAALDRLVAPGELTRAPLPGQRGTDTPETLLRVAAGEPADADTDAVSTDVEEPGPAAAEVTPDVPRVMPIPAAPEPAGGPRRRRGLRR